MFFFSDDYADKLVVEFKNSQPLELQDLSASLSALGNQFRRYVIREELKDESEAKLYVKEVRRGSTIIELFSYIQNHHDDIKMAIETSKSVIGFGSYLDKTYKELKDGKKPSADLTAKDIKDLSQVLEPLAKDPKGSTLIHADRGATVNLTLTLNSADANSIQNRATKLIETMRETEKLDYQKRAFYWDTASKGEPRRTDRGIIESIEDRPVPVIFDENSDIKEQMIAGKAHPFSTTYIVDVELIMLRNKIKAYKITKLHHIIEDEED